MIFREEAQELIDKSPYISRDLSWLKFNYRVLDQASNKMRNVFEKLKFIAITASNLDEFFMVRVGSLYNYIDYQKERTDYCGLRTEPFRVKLLEQLQTFVQEQNAFVKKLKSLFIRNNFNIVGIDQLDTKEKQLAENYFQKTIFPMLTPMVADGYHPFPMLMNNVLIFGVITKDEKDTRDKKKISFIQIPQNLSRFFEIERKNEILFLPIEEIIRTHLHHLFRNVRILSINLFRITRNGDYTIEESEDLESDFIDEIKRKLKTRRTGRVVRLEIEVNHSTFLLRKLKQKWRIDEHNIFKIDRLIDLSRLWQIVNHHAFRTRAVSKHSTVLPLALRAKQSGSVFRHYRKQDVLLHHPYNSMDHVLEMLEKAAEDPKVLAVKTTIYRLAKNSRVINALLKAAENGKHVSVLFELKARFDEENNIVQANLLQKAGCFVIHGLSNLKTHTKIMMIVRKEGEKITRYVHLATGNYNEVTSKLYTDIGLITARESYAKDVSEFFNAITGHSKPKAYDWLLTSPKFMRSRLITLVRQEAEHAKKGLPASIVIKINSLQDDKFIDALYKASQAGVKIKLIVRGICCLRPGREKLSENICVHSIVGDYLEHSRIIYFHNNNNPKILCGSADVMVRSFDRRIESLFMVVDDKCKQELINILYYALIDNVNSYKMLENGDYVKIMPRPGQCRFNCHKEFFKIGPQKIGKASLL